MFFLDIPKFHDQSSIPFHILLIKGVVVLVSKSQVMKTLKLKLNSVALVRKRTIPTERPQPADEVSANFS
jgi:hypothetical protein